MPEPEYQRLVLPKLRTRTARTCEVFAVPTGPAERVTRGRAAGAFRRERADHLKTSATPPAAAGCGDVRCSRRCLERGRGFVRGRRGQVFEAPVMGQVECSPGGVVEGGVFRALGVTFKEAPLTIDIGFAL